MSQENQFGDSLHAKYLPNDIFHHENEFLCVYQSRFAVYVQFHNTHTDGRTNERTDIHKIACKRVKSDDKQQIDGIFWTTIVIIINSVQRYRQMHANRMLANTDIFELMMMMLSLFCIAKPTKWTL